jgi:hypothetical protein
VVVAGPRPVVPGAGDQRDYQVLQAPHKELIWFEQSGHNMLYEDSARFNDLMVNCIPPMIALQLPPDLLPPVLN